ncbi:MAG TPA: TonB-dependent receptor [Candidatus Kapabacteria bacterium]|nr:TonB-dependent receptor [Candidatus Kapabacteria bacterium]
MITEQGSDQPVQGAIVSIVGTKLGARTKADGNFRIENVPVGRHELRVLAGGYETITQDILVTSGKQVIINLPLTAKVYKAEQVVVQANDDFKPINEAALSSATTFTVDEVKRFAGSREDPARMAQTFAGVVGVDDQRNDIIIRGGSPMELLWRLDGIDIPNPNHFATQGATGGPVNAINTNLLSNSDFLTGAFPAEYGDKLSGVFDLRTRKGNTEKYEFVGQLGFAGVEAMAEGPLFGNGSSFIASYRKSTLQVFDALGINFGFAGIPKYEDLTIKADIPLGSSDALSIISLGGTGTIDLFDSKKDTVYTGDFDITSGSDLGVAGATWKHTFNTKTIGEFSLSGVYQKYHTTVDSLTTDAFNHVTSKNLFYVADSYEGFYSAKYKLNYAHDVSNFFSAGIETRLPFYNIDEYRTTVRDEKNGIPYSIKANGNSFHALTYVNWQWRPNDALTFNTGVHAQYIEISKKTSIEPRFGAQWAFAEGQDLTAGFGVHRQSQPLVVYFGNAANSSLDYTQSLHYILGYSNRLASDLLLKVEGYYKDISHAPVRSDSLSSFSMLNAGSTFGGVSTDYPLMSTGLGRTYGIEFTLMKHFADGYYFTATSSLFRQRFTGSDGVWRNGAFDNKYIINLLAGYEWKLSPTFSIEFSEKLTLAGGAPYTPIDTVRARMFNASGQFGPQYYDETQAFAVRYPAYKRLDLKIEFRQNLGSVSIIGFITAENALNAKNILTYAWDARRNEITQLNQLGIFPYGGFRIEF